MADTRETSDTGAKSFTASYLTLLMPGLPTSWVALNSKV